MSIILVMEDDDRNYFLIYNILKNDMCEILHASNGEIGLQLVDQYQPDLILMDMRMPKLTGWDIAKILKSQDHTQSIPLIAMSALTEVNIDKRAQEAGFELFILKPFSVRQLRSIINHYLADC